jgi:hypothetical protein
MAKMRTIDGWLIHPPSEGRDVMTRQDLGVRLFLVAAVASFLLSIALWFTDNRDERVRRAVGAVDPRGRRLLDGRGQDPMTASAPRRGTLALPEEEVGRDHVDPRRPART